VVSFLLERSGPGSSGFGGSVHVLTTRRLFKFKLAFRVLEHNGVGFLTRRRGGIFIVQFCVCTLASKLEVQMDHIFDVHDRVIYVFLLPAKSWQFLVQTLPGLILTIWIRGWELPEKAVRSAQQKEPIVQSFRYPRLG